MEIEQGKIIQLGHGKATIQMESSSECRTCGARHACCSIGGETARRIEIPVSENREDLKEGDDVTIRFEPQTRIFSAFLVFIMPIILLITGYYIGMNVFATEGKAILTGFGGLLMAFIMIWGLNKFFAKEKRFIPTIDRSSS
ncbi:hypothetical protein GF337_11225 [candidate division KSB1 bacterium]|nr:hypothetical protein [candidate division KSB1 bacterium]